jgi:hypothetical protein
LNPKIVSCAPPVVPALGGFMEVSTGASNVNESALVPTTNPTVTTADTFEPEDGTKKQCTEVCVTGGNVVHARPANCIERGRLPSAKLFPPIVTGVRPRVGPF